MLCARPHKINTSTANQLVQQALVALGEKVDVVQVDPIKFPWAPDFYTFQASRPGNVIGPDGVSVLQTYSFAVNPWSGDVWDLIACRRISSPKLLLEQDSVRKRSQLSADLLKRLHDESPGNCSPQAP